MGLNSRTIKNRSEEDKTIKGPVGIPFPKNEMKVPHTPEIAPKIADQNRYRFICIAIREAETAGIISSAEARITPTICKEVMIQKAIRTHKT